MFSNHPGQFVGVLTRSRNPDSPSPVIILMTHLKGQLLDDVGTEVGLILEHDVVGWGNCALSHLNT